MIICVVHITGGAAQSEIGLKMDWPSSLIKLSYVQSIWEKRGGDKFRYKCDALYSSLFFKYKLAELQVPVERREVVAVSAAVAASACVKVSHQTRSPSSPASTSFSEMLSAFFSSTNSSRFTVA